MLPLAVKEGGETLPLAVMEGGETPPTVPHDEDVAEKEAPSRSYLLPKIMRANCLKYILLVVPLENPVLVHPGY